jgi:hypothetical protein
MEMDVLLSVLLKMVIIAESSLVKLPVVVFMKEGLFAFNWFAFINISKLIQPG